MGTAEFATVRDTPDAEQEASFSSDVRQELWKEERERARWSGEGVGGLGPGGPVDEMGPEPRNRSPTFR